MKGSSRSYFSLCTRTFLSLLRAASWVIVGRLTGRTEARKRTDHDGRKRGGKARPRASPRRIYCGSTSSSSIVAMKPGTTPARNMIPFHVVSKDHMGIIFLAGVALYCRQRWGHTRAGFVLGGAKTGDMICIQQQQAVYRALVINWFLCCCCCCRFISASASAAAAAAAATWYFKMPDIINNSIIPAASSKKQKQMSLSVFTLFKSMAARSSTLR